MSDLTALQTSAVAAIAAATTVKSIEELRIELLGKKGRIAAAMATLLAMTMGTLNLGISHP